MKRPAAFNNSQLPKRGKKPISIGSCCSGWCSELIAADSLKLCWESEFACDCDANVAKLNGHMHSHKRWFDDVYDRAFMAETCSVDFFMAGFPCQDFSLAGSGAGIAGSSGKVLLQVVTWIKAKQPRSFLLENVQGLYLCHKDVLLWLLKELSDMRDGQGKPVYRVKWTILDCKTHGGIPQSRERVFIAGVKQRHLTGYIEWPQEARFDVEDLSIYIYIVYCQVNYIVSKMI